MIRSIAWGLVAVLMLGVFSGRVVARDLAAHWSFEEGTGDVLRDSAGNSAGRIHDARWVSAAGGHALHFNGSDSYVVCAGAPGFDSRSPLTLEAWVYPDSLPADEPGIAGWSIGTAALTIYKTGSCYFYIGGGGNGVDAPVKAGQWNHVAGVFDGQTLRMYINGREARSRPSAAAEVKEQQGRFLIGCVGGDGLAAPASDDELSKLPHFAGMIDEVKLYRSALTARQIADEYSASAAARGLKPLDGSRFGKLVVQPFVYPELGEVIAAVDCQWLPPVPKGSAIRADLCRDGADAAPLESVRVKLEEPGQAVEAAMPLKDLGAGRYEVVATVELPEGKEAHSARASLTLPLAEPDVPAPSQKRAGPLPPEVAPPKYECDLAPGGGLVVRIGGRSYPIESRFSYPNGGENVLGSADQPPRAEAQWKIATSRPDARTLKLAGAGAHYAIERTVRLTPTRIEIDDTITNKGEDVLGVIFANGVNAAGIADARKLVQPNPTVFVSQGDTGVGIIALDDVYQLQQRTTDADGFVSILDEHFALDRGASYTVQWAIYPTATSDYFDFINQLRRDEGLAGHVDGSVELSSRWGPPPKEAVELKNLAYMSACSLTHALKDPDNSLEGWEFVEYPELCNRIRKAIAETKQTYPNAKAMFHVAHSLYMTDKPREKFGDSLIIDANGKLDHYGPNTFDYYGKYLARELFDKGWRWWLFYPTMSNSFGRHMLEAADYMIDNLGATAIWADGFIGGYCKGDYTYDTWDGHSATIDPKTKLVTRKKAHVTLLAMPVLKAVVQKFHDKGGVLIVNDRPAPRSMWRLPMITSNETGGGDQQPIAGLYVGQTVTPLGNPTVIKSERDVYRDILAKLDAGALYFFYGEQDFVKHRTLVSYMYPITFDAIHAGTVRGTDRIITNRSGAYGWPGDRSLHIVHPFDARGMERPSRFFTTVDGDGARTEAQLAEGESAAIIRLPIELESSEPVNVLVRQYSAAGIELALAGSAAQAKLRVRTGEFALQPGQAVRAEVGESAVSITVSADGVLVVPAAVNGTVRVRIQVPR